MKASKFTFSVLLIALSQFTFAQTGQWKLAGNNLSGTEKLGSTNNAAFNFITGNKTRMSLTSAGNLNISSDQSSIQFALPGAGPKPMMLMFPSGTANTNRMIIAHSPNFINFGLQYNDLDDRFDFLSAGTSIFNVNLGSSSVGVTGKFNVSGISTFSGDVHINNGFLGVGTVAPKSNLHVFKGSAGNVSPFFNAPLVVENSTNNYINLLSPSANESGILFGNPLSSVDGGIIYNSTANSRGLQFRTNGNVTRMVLASNGFLGVNNFNPATELHLVHANIQNGNHGLRIQNATSGDQWTFFTSSFAHLELYRNNVIAGFFSAESGEYFSFLNLKTRNNVEQASDVLQRIMQLNVKKYQPSENKTFGKKFYGMIPQEVEKIFPEVVSHEKKNGSNDYYTNNSAFGVIAIKAIQEQQATIEKLQSIIEKQQTTIEKLQSDMDDLKKRTGAFSATTNQSSNISNEASELSLARLNQNAPNPFNAATVISYYVPKTKGNAAQNCTVKCRYKNL